MDVGVVGLGNMGKHHVRIYSELRGVSNLYVYDVDKAKVEKYAKLYGVMPTDSYEELLSKVDAVSLVVPTSLHVKLAEKAIEKGVSILIEKPVASTVEEGKKLLALDREGLVVGVGHIERFNPVVGEIKKILRRPTYAIFTRHNPSSSRFSQVSIAVDLAIHDLDLALYLFNANKIVFSRSSNQRAVAFLHPFVLISVSRGGALKVRTLYIEEEDRTMYADLVSQSLTIYKKPEMYESIGYGYLQETLVEVIKIPKREPLREELKTFIECVRSTKTFPVTVEDGLNALSLAEEIERRG